MDTVISPGNNTATTKTVVDKIKKKKKRNRAIWFGLGGLLLVIIVLVVLRSGKEKAITVQTEKATTRTITEVVQATGKIQPETSVKISPEVSGEIIKLPFKEGDAVKQGSLLTEIKPTAIKAQYEAAVAQLEGAKAQAEQAKAQKLQAQLGLKRTKDLHAKSLTSDAELEVAQQQYDVAVANLSSAEHNVSYHQNNLTVFSESLRKTSVVSPMDGYITQLISQLGEKVLGTSQFSGTDIMTVSDLSVMNSLVDVDENDVVNVKVGDTARVTIDAFPDRAFVGTVVEVANSAELKGTGTQDQSTNFQVKVRLSGFQTGELRPGMSCTAKIETQTRPNILTVPIMSVTRRTDQSKKTTTEEQTSEVG
ncbi:MAG: efflux RND transporter periplasmic adaptor subunit, partial [Ignavibacteriota bacterium]